MRGLPVDHPAPSSVALPTTGGTVSPPGRPQTTAVPHAPSKPQTATANADLLHG